MERKSPIKVKLGRVDDETTGDEYLCVMILQPLNTQEINKVQEFCEFMAGPGATYHAARSARQRFRLFNKRRSRDVIGSVASQNQEAS